MSVAKKTARKILANCPPHESFWVNNGPIIKNLMELYRELKNMGEDTFRHHVNKEKNDFSKWIKDCLGDGSLATQIKKTKSKRIATGKVRTRLQQLKKVAS
tara:strand:- start:2253 stop:2555 length:303 start_codon:yes stop_codon:yes gene_type:complete